MLILGEHLDILILATSRNAFATKNIHVLTEGLDIELLV